jgi:ribosomal protein S3AE
MAIRKKFVEVRLPLIKENVSLLGTPESLIGQTIKLDLTRKLRGKSLEIVFKIYNNEGLYGLPKRLEILKFFIRRVMRKRASYVEDSFKTKCKDVEVLVKPFLVTRKKVSRAIRNNLRNVFRESIIEYIKEKSYLDICEELLTGELQKAMLPKLKKVYPLSFSDLRVFETLECEKIEFVYKKEEIKKEVEIKEKEKKVEEPETTIEEEVEKEITKEAKKTKKETKKTLKKKE